jgi:hypothetical protein
MSDCKSLQNYASFRESRDNMLLKSELRLPPLPLSNPSNPLQYLPFFLLVMRGKPFAGY